MLAEGKLSKQHREEKRREDKNEAQMTDFDAILINTMVIRQIHRDKVGISIAAEDGRHGIIRAWALVERKEGDRQIEEAEAVKMAMSKATEEGWHSIIIASKYKKAQRESQQEE
ncbi:hypothetical protein ACH5RR_035376 [Cinchona calisaya]|uniref:RNase H type-1 domain-containing protein n=1 Tax=Cinchona calisaya TaxID=153742 RepID=A0ABD2YDX2_9GENT